MQFPKSQQIGHKRRTGVEGQLQHRGKGQHCVSMMLYRDQIITLLQIVLLLLPPPLLLFLLLALV